MSFGSRIKERREQLNMSRKQLAELMGITASAVANYENEISSPKAELLYPLMEALKCDANYLYQDETRKLGGYPVNLKYEEHEHIKKYRSLDSFGQEAVDDVLDVEWRRCTKAVQEVQPEVEVVYFVVPWFFHPMSAGTGEEAGDEQPDDLRLIKAPPRGTSYVAPVSGDSMEPTYHNGDRLFIRSQESIFQGQVGVFFMDGKQWVKELGDGVLISHNSKYDPIPMREDIRCQGLVLGVCDESYFE